MSIRQGKNGISAEIILDSISEVGIRLTTFELVYPRIIHAELMTHRVFSRNAASSRAIPFTKMKEQLTAAPVRFGAANKGMQDTGEDFAAMVRAPDNGYSCLPNVAWEYARNSAIDWATAFHDAGYHKQIYNRLTEPFQMMKTIVTATEMPNFFWLRNDVAADPTLQELARVMFDVYNNSKPTLLKSGEWHLPYVGSCYDYKEKNSIGTGDFGLVYFIGAAQLSLEDAIKVSSARCAAVSFRNEDYDLEKSQQVYDRLVGDERKHSSAMEHQATPMAEWCENIEDCTGGIPSTIINNPILPKTWEKGISHIDRDGQLWSGNFRGWIQHRKLIDGENRTS